PAKRDVLVPYGGGVGSVGTGTIWRNRGNGCGMGVGCGASAVAHALAIVGDVPFGSGDGVRFYDNAEARRGFASMGVGLVRRDLEFCGVAESSVAGAPTCAGGPGRDAESTLEAACPDDAGLRAVHPAVDAAKFSGLWTYCAGS